MLVIVAVTLTALIGMGMIVVDVANWWVHKRHLQEQADAAALAGAQALRGCAASTKSAVNLAVAQQVQRYAGTTAPVGGVSTGQVPGSQQISLGGGESVLGALNAKTYPYPLGDGPTVNDSEANTGSPCDDVAVDVKLTDNSIPYLFTVGALGHVNVHSRVAVKQVKALTKPMPLAAEDPMPSTVKAVLVDESGSSPSFLTSKVLDPASDGVTFSGDVTLPTNRASVGVRINASGSGTASDSAGRCVTETAQQCYDATGFKGLALINSWSAQGPGTTDVVAVHAARVVNVGNCSPVGASMYFVPAAPASPNCLVTVDADVEFNSTAGNPPSNPGGYPAVGSTGASDNNASTVTLSSSASCGTSTPMTYKGAVSGVGNHIWEGQICVPANAGATTLSLQGTATNGKVGSGGNANCTKNSPCKSSVIAVQRVFTASTASSGNIDSLTITDAGGNPDSETLCTNSTGCPNHTFHITVHFKDFLQPVPTGTSPTPTVLRNQGNTISCDQDQSNVGLLQDFGTDPNPTPTPAHPVCAAQWFRVATPSDPCTTGIIGTEQAPSWCVDVRNGNGTNGKAIGDAVSTRIEGGTSGCPNPNHWLDAGGPDNSDPRLVALFTIFRWPGSNNVPVRVTGFAQFYVTSWATQNGGADPCGDPLPPGAGAGDVFGYYVSGDVPSGQGTPSDQQCNFNLVNPCIPVLID